jgi:hypothetical protein
MEGLDSLPYVCLRVPTGDGKKILLCKMAGDRKTGERYFFAI